MNTSVPKIFISYSWTNEKRVLELAERLVNDGVDVVIDKWYLKEGQDKYEFMEKSVTDKTIDRVLIICDKAYSEKADVRTGGVGEETMIISPEIYDRVTESKYIPVVFEQDEDGSLCIPAYLKSRIFIDLCENSAEYEKEYEKLLRNLHEKPEYSKPALGKMPEWLNEEDVSFFKIRNIVKQIQTDGGKNDRKVRHLALKFSEEMAIAINDLSSTIEGEDIGDVLLKKISVAKPLRDLFFDFIDALIMSDLDAGSILRDIFERIYNETQNIGGHNSSREFKLEFQKFLIWEMFIGTTAILLHYEEYAEIKNILHQTYFIKTDVCTVPSTFHEFRPYFQYIEGYIKPKSETPNLYTLAGDIVVKREKLPIITEASLANADLVLYQLSRVYEFPTESHHKRWFPLLYIYMPGSGYVNQPIWSKMISQKHCEKLFPLFGVDDIKDLKLMIERNKPEPNVIYPSGGVHHAGPITASIDIENIGKVP